MSFLSSRLGDMSIGNNHRHEPATRMRPRTMMETQPYLLGYSAVTSLIFPMSTIYNLGKLNPQIPVKFSRMASLSARVYPVQTFMRSLQMNASTHVKDQIDPWIAFALARVLQGGIFGQCNVYFSKQLGIAKSGVSVLATFRGFGCAAVRDVIAQGIPFMCGADVKRLLFDALLPTNKGNEIKENYSERSNVGMVGLARCSDEGIDTIKHWAAISSTSVVTTYASQGLHNCLVVCTADQRLSLVEAMQLLWARHGLAALYRGAEARVGYLMVINVLNELLLKPAWSAVPAE
mmetsp:Transcript_31848/g.53731  ORF Transcript_31848/g.53731 Transcript_31848/m.53731 type:complete len:291 (+) Transcript_31848:76-948(+)